MKNILNVLIITLVVVLPTTVLRVNANESKVEIPDIMQPDTIIEYVTDTKYKIISGGEATELEKSVNTISKEGQSALKKANPQNIVTMENVTPNKGTKVYYASDGRIKKIQVAGLTTNNMRANTCPNCGETYLPNGTILEANQWFQWGGKNGNNNYLEVVSSEVRGYGRFTNFTDKIGQNDHVLVAGDVATRYHVDNPAYGKQLVCNANGYTRTMVKRDVGCLPDAVLDIWKTGLSYFGVNWTSGASIYDASYTYKR